MVCWKPPGKRFWVLWVLHCCLGLEAGLEPDGKSHQWGGALLPFTPQGLPLHALSASPPLDQDGFSSSGESVCEGLDQGLDKGEAEASPHSSCCCCWWS